MKRKYIQFFSLSVFILLQSWFCKSVQGISQFVYKCEPDIRTHIKVLFVVFFVLGFLGNVSYLAYLIYVKKFKNLFRDIFTANSSSHNNTMLFKSCNSFVIIAAISDTFCLCIITWKYLSNLSSDGECATFIFLEYCFIMLSAVTTLSISVERFCFIYQPFIRFPNFCKIFRFNCCKTTTKLLSANHNKHLAESRATEQRGGGRGGEEGNNYEDDCGRKFKWLSCFKYLRISLTNRVIICQILLVVLANLYVPCYFRYSAREKICLYWASMDTTIAIEFGMCLIVFFLPGPLMIFFNFLLIIKLISYWLRSSSSSPFMSSRNSERTTLSNKQCSFTKTSSSNNKKECDAANQISPEFEPISEKIYVELDLELPDRIMVSEAALSCIEEEEQHQEQEVEADGERRDHEATLLPQHCRMHIPADTNPYTHKSRGDHHHCYLQSGETSRAKSGEAGVKGEGDGGARLCSNCINYQRQVWHKSQHVRNNITKLLIILPSLYLLFLFPTYAWRLYMNIKFLQLFQNQTKADRNKDSKNFMRMIKLGDCFMDKLLPLISLLNYGRIFYVYFVFGPSFRRDFIKMLSHFAREIHARLTATLDYCSCCWGFRDPSVKKSAQHSHANNIQSLKLTRSDYNNENGSNNNNNNDSSSGVPFNPSNKKCFKRSKEVEKRDNFLCDKQNHHDCRVHSADDAIPSPPKNELSFSTNKTQEDKKCCIDVSNEMNSTVDLQEFKYYLNAFSGRIGQENVSAPPF